MDVNTNIHAADNGLFECHGHIMLDGEDYRLAKARHCQTPDESAVRDALAALKAAEVTYFRDGGDRFGVCRLAAELAPEYGIEYIQPAFAIYPKGHYGGIVGKPYADIPEYRQILREVRAEGGDFVKLIVSGIICFDVYGHLSCPPASTDEIRELISIAHGEGFSVMVHANGAETVRAAAAEADSIEHGYFADEAAVDAMGESGTVWVPTLAAVSAFEGREGFDKAVVKETLERQMIIVADAASAGLDIAAGSDSGAAGVLHGSGTVDEYRLLTQAGVSADALLRANKKLRGKFSKA